MEPKGGQLSGDATGGETTLGTPLPEIYADLLALGSHFPKVARGQCLCRTAGDRLIARSTA